MNTPTDPIQANIPEVSTEAQRQALDAMSDDLVRKLNAMIAEQDARVQEFAKLTHSLSAQPEIPQSLQVPLAPQPISTAPVEVMEPSAPLPRVPQQPQRQQATRVPQPPRPPQQAPRTPADAVQQAMEKMRETVEKNLPAVPKSSPAPKRTPKQAPATKEKKKEGCSGHVIFIIIVIVIILRACSE